MLDDERATFASPVASCQMSAAEHTVVPRDGPVAMKLVRLLELECPEAARRPHLLWDDHSRGLVGAHSAIVRHVLDVPTETPAEASPLRCAAIDEVGFASVDHLLRAVRTEDFTVLRDRAGHVIGSARVFVTDEVVLYDATQLDPLTFGAR